MTFFFGLDLLKTGQDLRFWLTLGSEAAVIVLAYFALKKRDELRAQRKKELEDIR